MNVEQNRVKTVLQNMINLVVNDEDYAEMFSDELESMLNELSFNDAFGTEGQLDPRGDQRDGPVYTMDHVQFVDSE